MTEIQIRTVEEKDLEQIKRIMNETWEYDKMSSNNKVVQATVNTFLNAVLNRSTFGKAAVKDKQVVGFVFGQVINQKPIYRSMQSDSTSDILAFLNASEEDRKMVLEEMSFEKFAYDKLIEGKEDEYDGSIELFAVSKAARGHRVGSRLLEEMMTYFEENDAPNIYLYTDTSCNFLFYEHKGFKRTGSVPYKSVDMNETNVFTHFMYEYKLNKK